MEVSPCGTFIDKNARDRTIILDTRRPAAVITVSARNEETVNLIFAVTTARALGFIRSI